MAKSSAARQERMQRSRDRESILDSVRNPAREAAPADLDRLIHEHVLLKASDGNLSVHARKLEEADYIVCEKSFDGRTPKTEYRLTSGGRKALERYLNHMEALIRATRER